MGLLLSFGGIILPNPFLVVTRLNFISGHHVVFSHYLGKKKKLMDKQVSLFLLLPETVSCVCVCVCVQQPIYSPREWIYASVPKGDHGLLYAAAAKSLQSCLTLCNPVDGSPPGSPVPGIVQARVLE